MIANAVDQFLMGQATQIEVRHDNWSLEVWDDGAGFPLDSALGGEYLTLCHFSPSRDHHAPHIHLVAAGTGIAPINATSASFQIESVRDQQTFRACYSRGELVSQDVGIPLEFERGTRVRLELDRELWQAGFEKGRLRRRVFDLVHLFPKVPVRLNEEKFYSEYGLLELGLFELEATPEQQFGFRGESDFLFLNVAFLGESRGRTRIRSWANGASTEGHGSHVDGAVSALTRASWRPAQVLIHVVMREPAYAGPSKRLLKVDRVKREVRALLRQPLLDFRPGKC